jgi:hypothetical protein
MVTKSVLLEVLSKSNQFVLLGFASGPVTGCDLFNNKLRVCSNIPLFRYSRILGLKLKSSMED